MYSSGERVYAFMRELFATQEINTKITLRWTHKLFVTRLHISFYLLHDMTNPQMTMKTTIFTHRPCVSLADSWKAEISFFGLNCCLFRVFITALFVPIPAVSDFWRAIHLHVCTRFTFCWWLHNRLLMTSQWPVNCDASMWQVISNLLDIDFIHGDIHGRSC